MLKWLILSAFSTVAAGIQPNCGRVFPSKRVNKPSTSRGKRIASGSPVLTQSFPWMVIVYQSGPMLPKWVDDTTTKESVTTTKESVPMVGECDGNRCYVLCSGTIISDSWVMTAAHCTTSKEQMIIYAGTTQQNFNRYEPLGGINRRTVDRIVLHHSVDRVGAGVQADIALLKVKPRFIFNENIQPICLPKSADNIVGRQMTITGWGSTDYGGKMPLYLHQTTISVIDNADRDCIIVIRNISLNPNSVLCAAPDTHFHGSMSGDSGGPLQVRESNGRWYQYGILSTVHLRNVLLGYVYAKRDVFTSVSYFCTFIERWTNARCI